MTLRSLKSSLSRVLLALGCLIALIGLGLFLNGTALFSPNLGQAQLLNQADVLKLNHIEGAQNSTARWQSVALPHYWDRDWPTFSGALWYRLQWQQTDQHPRSLLITSMNMAGSVYVNGQLLHQDTQLVEPLSRSWNMPYRTIIPPALIQAGTNIITVRIQGYAKYPHNGTPAWDAGGLSPLWVGSPTEIEQLYQSEFFFKRDLAIFNLAANITLGLIFAALGWRHRQEPQYAWFAIACLAWTPLVINQIVTSPWPFNHSAHWQRMLLISSALYVISYALFLMQMIKIRLPMRTRYALGLCVLFSSIVSLLPGKLIIVTLLFAFALIMQIIFLYRALRFHSFEFYVMMIIVFTVILTLSLDLMVGLSLLTYRPTLVPLAGNLFSLGMAMILAWRFVRNGQQIEQFQTQMQHEIHLAEQALSEQLHHQHQLDLNHSRIGERLNLVRDLHSGFGRMLNEYAERLRQQEGKLKADDWATILKALRDDLRLIIETGNQAHTNLEAQLPPIRRRLTEAMEQANIQGKWHIKPLAQAHLPLFTRLNILRFLQDAIGYTIHYAQAKQINITLDIQHDHLLIDVTHNGSKRFIQTHTQAWQNILLRTPNTQGVLKQKDTPPGLSLWVPLPKPIKPATDSGAPHD
ncbi:MAG: hypothetical protein KA498_10440 [Neisseriaceae bacterium]|nr:hypothetical protein [Neisseriaceae bacterium]